jgi:predicted DCC family thiol-disulfide oxidoreductase YuxK
MPAEQATVYYDADCGFCRWTLGLLLSWDRGRRLVPRTIQGSEAELAGVPAARRLESAHVRLSDGRVFSGGAAIEHVAPLLPAGAPLAALAHRLPRASDRGYRFVAGHRTDVGPRLPRSWIAWGDRVIAARARA